MCPVTQGVQGGWLSGVTHGDICQVHFLASHGIPHFPEEPQFLPMRNRSTETKIWAIGLFIVTRGHCFQALETMDGVRKWVGFFSPKRKIHHKFKLTFPIQI